MKGIGVRETRIISAIRDGICTSPALAIRLRITRNLMSVTLYNMAGRGFVVRGRRVVPSRGCPPIAWKLGPALEAAQ